MGLTSCRRLTIAGKVAHRERGAQREFCRALPRPSRSRGSTTTRTMTRSPSRSHAGRDATERTSLRRCRRPRRHPPG